MPKNFGAHQSDHNVIIKLSIGLVCLLAPNYSTYPSNLTTNNPNIMPQPTISMFGDTITNQRHAQINVSFAYSIPADAVTSNTNAGGTVIQANSMAVLSTGTATAGTAVASSTTAIQYIPGHDVEYLFTAMFTPGVANSTQWIGALTANDGFAVGYNGANFALLYRHSGTISTITQTNFNTDRLNGTGFSNFTIDPTKLNIFRISFGWLGASPITFWIMRQDGSWWKFHTLQLPNSLTTPSINMPQLPLRAEVTNTGNTSSMKLSTAAWMGGTIGENDATVARIYTAEILGVTNVTTEVPLLTIKNKGTYQDKPNYLNLNVLLANVSSQTPSDFAVFRLIKNANLIGASFSDYATGLSFVQTDTTASAYTNGTKMLAIFDSNDSSTNLSFANNGISIVLLPNDTLTITGYATSTATLNASLCWQEPTA